MKNNQDINDLKKTAQEAAALPGCYIMRGQDGDIIYVGKAKSLRHRLSSYFSGNKDIKTTTLLRHVFSIETIIVGNEYEALLLENTLIKQHSPKYNINLKDGKTYPVVRITAEDFPVIFRTRHIVQDGSRYFGPFPSVHSIDAMMQIIRKSFPLRKCRRLKKRAAPCIYFHIKRCAAPCCGKITKDEYGLHLNRIARLLSGNTDALVMELTEDMHKAAREFNFELAIRHRDVINAVQAMSAENTVVDFDQESRDYIAWAQKGVITSISVFSMRGGKLTGRELFRTKSASTEQETVETFVTTYYTTEKRPPARIFVQNWSESPEPDVGVIKNAVLLRYFNEKFGFKPEFCFACEKRHTSALAMAHHNAVEDLEHRLKERGLGPVLEELQRLLSLPQLPQRIEGFDIAQLDGKHPVASLISFWNGLPDKKNYRHFKLKTVVGIVDDFSAMREAVRRRYSRSLREGKDLPDLILIDGGIGQVNAAKGVLAELGMETAVVGLAKRDEELWLPEAKTPIRLAKSSEALHVLQHIRDETHRFATGLNQKLREKDIKLGVLESIDGIGAGKAALLIKEFVSLQAICDTDVETIAKTGKINKVLAKTVKAVCAIALENIKTDKAELTKHILKPAPENEEGAYLMPSVTDDVE